MNIHGAFQIINNIDPNKHVQEPPVGALILAVQAVS